jgi:hypothetical protein
MPNDWNLRYDERIIGDGEPDRSVGDIFDWFAVEFWSREGLAKVNEDAKSATAIPNFEYKVSAEVVCLSEKACIIDFGVRAVGPRNTLPSGCQEGDYVEGKIGIGIPLCTDVVPTQFVKGYRWRVNRISADLTPLLPGTGMHDYSRSQCQLVDSTESVKTQSYILHCYEVAEGSSASVLVVGASEDS